ncbi:MAG: thiamine pyrophosphate-dependent dehydrogenase E1 component subunit alpha [Solirubrobacterales bacterium]|nr:thiamine pyrophosphate-dependent dehydrogenase E1 component subunit alpha [Solirubrobacterales bacterium]
MQPLVLACEELATRAGELGQGEVTSIDDYAGMLRIRRTEEELARLKRGGLVAPNIHQSIGQEAVSVGGVGALRRDDFLTSTYRGRGHALGKGASLRGVVAEVLHRETGLARGRSGPMHMVDASCNLIFESAIVGGAAPLAVGAALAANRLGTDAVAMTLFGEGATSQGTVHEALNLAGAWKLPVIFVLENNGYSEMTPAADTTALADFSWRALGHGIPAIKTDGNSIPAVRPAVRAAIQWARAGHGPVLVEAMTYRLTGHYAGEPGLYRPAGELDAAKERDPIGRAVRELLERGVTQSAIDATGAAVETEVADAVQFALDSPPADPAGVSEHVYQEAI